MENCRVIEIPEIVSVETSFVYANQIPENSNRVFYYLENAEKDKQSEVVPTRQPMLSTSSIVQTMRINAPTAQNVPTNAETTHNMYNPPTSQTMLFNPPTSQTMLFNPPTSQPMLFNPPTSQPMLYNSPTSQPMLFNPPTSQPMLMNPSTMPNRLMNPLATPNMLLNSTSGPPLLKNLLMHNSTPNMLMNPPTSQPILMNPPTSQPILMNSPTVSNFSMNQKTTPKPPLSQTMLMNPPLATTQTMPLNMPTLPTVSIPTTQIVPMSQPPNFMMNPKTTPSMPMNLPTAQKSLPINPLPVQTMLINPPTNQPILLDSPPPPNETSNSTPPPLFPMLSNKTNSTINPTQPTKTPPPNLRLAALSKDISVQASPLSVNTGTQCRFPRNRPHRNRSIQTDIKRYCSISVQCELDDSALSEPEIESDPIEVDDNEKVVFETFVNAKSATYEDDWSECLICGEVCKYRTELNHHMALHYGPSVLCPHCGLQFEHHALYAGHKCKGKLMYRGKENQLRFKRRVLCQHASCPAIRVPSSRYTATHLLKRRRLVQICGHSSCNKSKKKKWFKRRLSTALNQLKRYNNNNSTQQL